MRASIAVLALLLLAGCGRLKGATAQAQAATGETPIRYVLCDDAGADCFVAARFANVGACETHKARQAAACIEDRRRPGRVTCDSNPQSSTATKSYCLR